MVQRFNIPAADRDAGAIELIDEILQAAIARGASDVHIEPTADGAEVRLRIDGLLEVHATHNKAVGRMLVTRLMVMAHLLTYRLDIPQEGRLQFERAGGSGALELRLAIMPTTHGLRAAVRMPAELLQPRSLDELHLPDPALRGLKQFAANDSGMLIVSGPAGSGKTTTIYALLQYIAQLSPGLSLIALEDPVERDLPGVTQIEVSAFGQLTYERALRSVLRQDPQVLMLGEIRDVQTATLAVQAALAGHRMICTLHAATPGGAIARLIEMGLEPYRITSALHGVMAQRLLRKLADHSGKSSTPISEPNSLASSRYHGRIPIAEFVQMSPALRAAILNRTDADALQKIAAKSNNYSSLRDSANSLVAQHLTDTDEVQRVLGEIKRDD